MATEAYFGIIKNRGDWLNGRALGSGSRGSGFDSRVPDSSQLNID